MGYYSDVALVLTKKGIKKLNMSLKQTKVKDKTRQEVKDLFAYAYKHSSDSKSGSEMWYWDSIKWYDCDPEYCPEVDLSPVF